MDPRRNQIQIWELANEYSVDWEEARKELSVAGLHRNSIMSLVPEVQARRILENRGHKSDRRRRPAHDRDQRSGALSEAAELFGVDERGLKSRQDATKQPRQRAAGPPSRPKRELTEWDRNFIEPAEAMEWRDHGVHDVNLALKAMQLGLGPQDMKIRLDGVPVWQRLANGESVASVRSRLREREAESG